MRSLDFTPEFQNISDDCKDLIIRLTKKNTTERLNFKNIIEHSFFSKKKMNPKLTHVNAKKTLMHISMKIKQQFEKQNSVD